MVFKIVQDLKWYFKCQISFFVMLSFSMWFLPCLLLTFIIEAKLITIWPVQLLNISLKINLFSKGCLSLINCFIDMSPELMSPFFVKRHVFSLQKNVFLTKNGLINSGFISIKQLNKEGQPLVDTPIQCLRGTLDPWALFQNYDIKVRK